MNRYVILPASIVLTLLFTIPISLAQAAVIDLSVFPTGGSSDKEFAFTISWDTSATSVFPNFEGVSFQYKKSGDSTWKTYSTTEGTPTLILLDTATTAPSPTTIRRQFFIKPNVIPEIGNSGSLGVYNFRVRDVNYAAGNPYSNQVTIAFGDDCTRSSSGSLNLLEGSGYKKVSVVNAEVDISEGNKLGSGTILQYDFTVSNNDNGCGTSSTFQVDALGTGIERETISGNSGDYKFTIAGIPSGIVEIDEGKTVVFRIQIEADNDIAPGVKPFGVATFRATNLDAQSEGLISKVERSGRITASTIRDCTERSPTIKFHPSAGRSGFASDELEYLVTIRNENEGGCNPEQFRITQAGVQEITSQSSSSGTIADPNSWRWGFTARIESGGVIGDKILRNTGQTSTFTTRNTNYVRFTPSSTMSFVLGNSDDLSGGTCKTCEKKLILKVTSYGSDNNRGPRSIALCVNQNSACGIGVYRLLDPFTEVRPPETSESLGITDDKLHGEEATLPPPGGGGTPIDGGTPIGPPSGIDSGWFSTCKQCTIQSKMGFKVTGSNTGICVAARATFPALYSADGQADDGKQNWIYLPTEESKRILGADQVSINRVFSCEKPPPGIGLASSGTTTPSSGTTPTSDGVNLELTSDKNSYNVGDLAIISGTLKSGSTGIAGGVLNINYILPGGKTSSATLATRSDGSFSSAGTIPNLANSGSIGNWRVIAEYSSGSLSKEILFNVGLPV